MEIVLFLWEVAAAKEKCNAKLASQHVWKIDVFKR